VTTAPTPGASDEVPVAPPCAIVIFGAAGDLTKRLVVPALYNMVTARRLPDAFQLVGVDLAEQTSEDWRAGLTTMIEQMATEKGGEFEAASIDKAAWDWLGERMTYLRGDLNDPDAYKRLGRLLAGLDKTKGTAGNHLFYLAIADRFFATTVAGLGAAGLTTETEGQWRRVVIEKPFGHDLASAKALNADILKTLSESQIYRIDHFLGKETVQNIMALRFANGLFEPIWNRDHITEVQITAAETVGVELRGKFYERTGALRDMVPNHMFQLLAMTAMEPPISFDADAVRTKKAEVVQAIHRMDAATALENTARGQYGAGTVLGKRIEAYRKSPDVAAVLCAHRQGAAAAQHRDRHPVPPGALRPLPRHAGGADASELDDPAHPARRGHRPGVRRQAAGPDHPAQQRLHGFRLRDLFPRGARDRLRDPDL